KAETRPYPSSSHLSYFKCKCSSLIIAKPFKPTQTIAKTIKKVHPKSKLTFFNIFIYSFFCALMKCIFQRIILLDWHLLHEIIANLFNEILFCFIKTLPLL